MNFEIIYCWTPLSRARATVIPYIVTALQGVARVSAKRATDGKDLI